MIKKTVNHDLICEVLISKTFLEVLIYTLKTMRYSSLNVSFIVLFELKN